MTEVLTYEALKADRDALSERVERLSGMLTESRHATKAAVERADALAVENAAQGAALSLISGCYGLSPHIQSMCAVETPATSAALSAIEARGVEKYAELFNETVNMERKHNQEFYKGAIWFAKQLREAK